MQNVILLKNHSICARQAAAMKQCFRRDFFSHFQASVCKLTSLSKRCRSINLRFHRKIMAIFSHLFLSPIYLKLLSSSSRSFSSDFHLIDCHCTYVTRAQMNSVVTVINVWRNNWTFPFVHNFPRTKKAAKPHVETVSHKSGFIGLKLTEL